MPHSQITWIDEADDPQRTFRRMVVGWQNILITMNATVLAFNAEYLKPPDEKNANPHHGMKEIAIKKLVIGALREIKPQLDDWYRSMDELGALTDKTKDEKKRVRAVARQVDKFVRIRNNAFHFGDPNEDTDWLIQLYKEIENADINLLNQVLRDFVSLGECLKADALAKSQ